MSTDFDFDFFAEDDDLSTADKRLRADIKEAFGTVCALRDRALTTELRNTLANAAAALYDAEREARRIAEA